MTFEQPSRELSDILSNYPEVAKELYNTSKDYYDISMRGLCNSSFLDHEIVDNIVPELGSRAIFYRNIFSEDGYDLKAQLITVFPQFDDNEISKKEFSAFTSKIETSYSFDSPESYRIYSNDFLQSIDVLLTRGDIYIDVITAYKIYGKRVSCTANDPNYARNKTKEYFNTIIKIFDQPDMKLQLNLYLIINAFVLNVEVDAVDYLLSYNVLNDEYYEEYVIETADMRSEVYNSIIYKIDHL